MKTAKEKIKKEVTHQKCDINLRSVDVKGSLRCGSVPAEGARVQLYRVKSENASEIIDSRTVGPSGLFNVNGNTQGKPINQTDIEPILRIFHKCGDDAKKTGHRRFQLGIPKDFVSNTRMAKHTYDIGEYNLDITYPGEKRDKNFQ
uniref:Transthyretin-like family protein n=1 Tax=Ditylenchus dipsaci TaxID=166011 RepID=A0A915DA05_9BILA